VPELSSLGSVRGALSDERPYRECENSDAKLSNPIFAEFWPILSDQKPVNHKTSL